MANAYDDAVRVRVVAAYERGRGTYRELADLFGLGSRTLGALGGAMARGRLAGGVAQGRWLAVPSVHLAVLHHVIADAPDAICAELCGEYNRRVSPAQRTTPSRLSRAMRRAGYVLKKRPRPMNWGTNLTLIGAIRCDGRVTLATRWRAMTADRFTD